MASTADLGVHAVHARLGSDEDAPEILIEPGRFNRAVKLAEKRGQIMRQRDFYRVRSQSGGGSYMVEEQGRLWLCECADASPLRPCQHVLGVLLYLDVLPFPHEVGEPVKPQPGGGVDWAAYVKAERSLGEQMPRFAWRLFEQLPTPERFGRGRPPIPQTDSLLCALMWSISQKNARQEQATRDRLFEDGLLSRTVAPNDVSRTLVDKATTPLLQEALRRSREPFAAVDAESSPLTLDVMGDTFAVDSTGFTPSRRGHYNTSKHGPSTPLPWLKCHLMISTKAHLITSARITSSHGKGTGDSSQFAPLLTETAEEFPVGVIVGDGAYASRANVTAVRDVGAKPFFRLAKNTISKQLGAPGWADMVAFFTLHRAEFDRIYHRRSLVESVNSAIKRRFGESLRSRTATSRVNELLCKLLAYNLVVLVQQLHFLHAEDEWLDRIL
jgi:hypothetical protein